MWPECNTTNGRVEEVTDAQLKISLSEYRLIICDERDNGSLGTWCDQRHEHMEKSQDYVLGKVRLQATEITASVKNYYSRKKRLIYYSFVFLNEMHSSDWYPSEVKENAEEGPLDTA